MERKIRQLEVEGTGVPIGFQHSCCENMKEISKYFLFILVLADVFLILKVRYYCIIVMFMHFLRIQRTTKIHCSHLF